MLKVQELPVQKLFDDDFERTRGTKQTETYLVMAGAKKTAYLG